MSETHETGELMRCINSMRELDQWARNADGGIRNPRWVAASAMGIARIMQTVHKVRDAFVREHRIKAFHQALIEGLRQRDPTLAADLALIGDRIATDWRP